MAKHNFHTDTGIENDRERENERQPSALHINCILGQNLILFSITFLPLTYGHLELASTQWSFVRMHKALIVLQADLEPSQKCLMVDDLKET